MKTPALVTTKLGAAYQKGPVIFDINLSIPEGSITGVIGPNGAGKSTLIKAILGLIPKCSGSVQVFGQPLKYALKRVGYIPQKSAIDWDFPASVQDVVLMGTYAKLGLFSKPSEKEYELVEECLKKVDMLHFADTQIGSLSGGQQQRVFMARALAQEADLYFMDEPFAGVDIKTESAIIDILKSLKMKQKSIVVVHHDLSTVERYFDHIILLNRQVVAHGPTNEVFTSKNLEITYEGKLHFFQPLSL